MFDQSPSRFAFWLFTRWAREIILKVWRATLGLRLAFNTVLYIIT